MAARAGVIVCCALMALATAATQPNFVVIMTDDQDIELGGWTPMTKTNQLLAVQGAIASNWFIHTPVCCPSRAQFFTGRYFHNVRNDSPQDGCMHVNETKVNPHTFAHRLGEAGYRVGLFGKYLNTWDIHKQTWPPGFERWFANNGGNDVEPGGYINASFQDQAGVYTGHPGEFAGYTTSIVGNKSIEWVRSIVPSAKPFAVIVTPKAPHIASTPPTWYENAFSDRTAPRTPSYNYSALDHHWLIAQQPPITLNQSVIIDEMFRDRWRTLLAVDDLVADMVTALEELGVLNNTYIFFTSDHGYQLGQLRLPMAKLNVYDHDIRIPFAARGPGIKPGTKLDAIGSNVDLAPTILDLAGLQFEDLDGISMVPQLTGGNTTSTSALVRECHYVEYFSLGTVIRLDHLVDVHNNTYRALRCLSPNYGNILYAEFTDLPDWHFDQPNFYEYYDLDADPYQLQNIYHKIPQSLIKALHDRIVSKFTCEGSTCHSRIPVQ